MHRLCLVLLAICIKANDIRITEVMSNPQGSEYENEFVEIYNASDHVMQINGWILSDGTGIDTLSHLVGPTGISPGHYALIVDPSYDLISGTYQQYLHDSLPIYTLSTDASFGSGGLSNSGESVLIHSPDTLVSTEMAWTSSSQNGYSWERVDITTPDSISLWEESLVINGTPGSRNSVTPPLVNLGIKGITIEYDEVSEPVEITLQIENTGENQISEISVLVFLDENQNGSMDSGEYAYENTFDRDVPSQTVIDLPLVLFTLRPGVHYAQLSVITPHDEVTSDDSLVFVVKGEFPLNAVSITEIMFSPGTDQGGEWFEIQNISVEPISLQGWTFSDANQTRHQMSEAQYFIEPASFLTICNSSSMSNYFGLESADVFELASWPALNSTSDSVRLFDPTGKQVATAFYRGSWGGTATSLERRHPLSHPHSEINWMPSSNLDGGTPSRMNTRTLLPVQVHIEDINVTLPELIGPTQAEIGLEFRNMGMDTLRSLEVESDADIHWLGALPTYAFDTLVFSTPMLWPGYNQIPIRLHHGNEVIADTSIQIILGFPENQIALNEIHYIPHDDQVEFLEFVNISDQPLDAFGWSFVDRSGGRGEVYSIQTILPDSMFIWTENLGELSTWAPPDAQITELSNWPSLNNSSDSIIILDPLGRRMLAHGYEDPPDGVTGRSLERIALWKPQSWGSSWGVCDDPLGITPGRDNSLLVPANNVLIQEVKVLDSLIMESVPFTVEVLVINAGSVSLPGAQLNLRFSCNESDIIARSYILPTISAGDSLVWARNYILEVSGWINLDVEIEYSRDENSQDNGFVGELYVTGKNAPLVVNEVMPLPIVGAEEWVEIYNLSDYPVNLMNWSIADQSGSGIILSDTSYFLHGKNYLVVGEDLSGLPFSPKGDHLEVSHFPTLNNTEDAVILFDPQGIPMDEMAYNAASELIQGRSLERIRPIGPGHEYSNWSICINEEGSTPGRQNSLYLEALSDAVHITLDPNPFSPNGDGQADQLVVNYELPFEYGIMYIMIFDMAGRKIAEPVQAKPVSHKGQVFWDGEASYGGKAVTGLYIMKLLLDDQAGKVWKSLKKVYLIR